LKKQIKIRRPLCNTHSQCTLFCRQVLDTAKEAAIELDKVAKTKEGKQAIFSTPLAISRLMALLPTANMKAVRWSVRVLATLSMDSSGRAKLSSDVQSLGSGAIEALSVLLASSDVESVQCASLVVGNLVLDDTGRRLCLGSDTLLPNVRELLWSTDLKTQRYIAGALRNISFDSSGSILSSDARLIGRLKELLSGTDENTSANPLLCTHKFYDCACCVDMY
jgi:hypothetical protein